MEKEEVKISVRELVEFILRSGDIDNRRGGWADKESLAKGTRIHKKIQRQMGAAYQAEVPLNCRFCYEDLDLLVEGRADGIEEKEDHVMVDEIKGVHRELRFVEEPVPVHLAQARCYAAIYAEQNQLEQMEVQMTYCNMETEEIRRFSYMFDAQELKTWFQKLADTYYIWAHWHQGVEKSEECIHDRTGISFPLPGGTAGTGTWCLPDHFAGKAVVYPGTHRCGQNDVMSVSCCALRWRRNFRKNLLSDCKNDYPYGCRGSF